MGGSIFYEVRVDVILLLSAVQAGITFITEITQGWRGFNFQLQWGVGGGVSLV
jgi:hypothetical protein